MASTDHLSIDSAGVRGASATVDAGSSEAGTQPVAIAPSASDVTSVLIANVLGGLVSTLINDTAAANARAAAAAARLSGNADTYDQQEFDNAQALGGAGGGMPGAAAVTAVSALLPTPAMPAPSGTGVTPSTGRQIAALIHGGPGPGALETAASLLRTHAGQLDGAADSIRSARQQNDAAWSSGGADAARGHLVTLEDSYADQAEQARRLAGHATTQAQNFRTARDQIPPPEHFDDLERRLVAANRANNAPGSVGRFTPVVVKYQTALADANTQAVNGFGGYTRAAADVHALPMPHQPNASDPVGPSEPAAPAPQPPAKAPRAPEEPMHAHAGPGGGGTDVGTAGTGPPGVAVADPGAGLGAGGPVPPAVGGNDMFSTLLPTVIGGVAGMSGGLLGALSGAGQKIQQAGTQLMSGLGQAASSAMGGMPSPEGGGSPESGGDPGGGDPSMADGGGGGDGGGATEPASSVGGPLSAAPASAAAAPAAAPAMYSATSAPSVLAAPGGGVGGPMGGAMMPPMMGGHGAGGGGQDQSKLYPERKLKVEAPPNSEPVRNRVEQRAARTDRGDGNK